jgi:hypothetical protein
VHGQYLYVYLKCLGVRRRNACAGVDIYASHVYVFKDIKNLLKLSCDRGAVHACASIVLFVHFVLL